MSKQQVLVAPDVAYSVSRASQAWLRGLCWALQQLGYDVVFCPREKRADAFHADLVAGGVKVLKYRGESEQEDATGHKARFRARTVVRAHKKHGYRWIVAQGIDLVRYLAGSGALGDVLWGIVSDAPYRGDLIPHIQFKDLQRAAEGCHRLLVASEASRSIIETEVPSTAGRVGLIAIEGMFATEPTTVPPSGSHLSIDLEYLTVQTMPQLEAYVERARERRRVPAVIVEGVGGEAVLDLPVWRRMPGLIKGPSRGVVPAYGLIPTGDAVAARAAARSYRARGIVPVGIRHGEPGILSVDSASDLLSLEVPSGHTPLNENPRSGKWFPPAQPLVELHRDRPLRVVMAGADFKFAGEMISTLATHPQIDLRVDLFKHNAEPQPEVSAPYVDWAEVVIAEFASRNAIWYSQHVRPDQQLIVHLHGYELMSDWIDELNLANVSAIVVASEFYRQRALALKGWPDEKVVVIGNSVDVGDLQRAKSDDARFHLGIAGIVPILKRPDRAVDLLRLLLEVDSRYVLHVRGHSPWNYAWEWKKSAHQDAYRSFYRRVAEDAALRQAISFEPFGPDMGNWLRRVGWILSPSTRETFHLAGIEGAASGAVPLVWEREGSREIFTDRWNFADTEAIAQFVLHQNEDPARYAAESRAAMEHATVYSTDVVCGKWLQLIDDLVAAGSGRVTPQGTLGAELASVDAALEEGGYEAALARLDEIIAVTAKATGPLKDVELWVRGVAALDARRFSLFLPGGGPIRTRGARPTTIRVKGSSDNEAALLGLERRTVDVVPPRALADSLARFSDDIQFDKADFVLSVDGDVRGDRWIETIASHICRTIEDGVSDVLVVQGPWWLALTVAMAADRLELPFYWAPTNAADLVAAQRAHAARFSGDFQEQLTLAVLSQAAGVVDSHGLLEESDLGAEVTVLDLAQLADRTSGGYADAAEQRSSPLRRYEGIPAALTRTPADVTALVIGAASTRDALGQTGVSMVQPTRISLLSQLSPTLDLLVIDAESADDPVWGDFIAGSAPTTVTKAAAVYDKARALGVTTVFFTHPEHGIPARVMGTARKADIVVARQADHAAELLELNPASTQKVLIAPQKKAAASSGVFLRELLQPVAVTRPSRPAEESTPDAQAPPTMESVELAVPDEDGISVVLATHNGAGRVGGMLRSLAKQTLPLNLVEVIVVENGSADGTQLIVEEFASAHPLLSMRYIHLIDPGVGNARNIGISAAGSAYLTFVDDDDELEPNYLLSMWLSAGANNIVVGTLTDVDAQGEFQTETPTTNRVRALNGQRVPVAGRAGILGLNACKLIPTAVAQQLRYPEKLRSGEDVVYMAQLLGHKLEIVPAAPMKGAAYLRHLRDDSISRRELDFGFAVEERLQVLTALEALRVGLPNKQAQAALSYLQSGQYGFIRRHLETNPQDRARARARATALGLATTEVWSTLSPVIDAAS